MHLSSPHCIINKFILSIYYVMIHSKMDRMDHYILFQRVHICIAHEHGHELNILILHEYATCSGWLTNRSIKRIVVAELDQKNTLITSSNNKRNRPHVHDQSAAPLRRSPSSSLPFIPISTTINSSSTLASVAAAAAEA